MSLAGPLDYAIPPPALNLADLKLPAAPPEIATNATEETARALRDRAILAFNNQQYALVIELFDRMPDTTVPAPQVQRMRAWSATLAGLDQPAEALWAQQAAAAPSEVQPLEMAAWHAFRLKQAETAMIRYAATVRLDPANARLRHMSGLSAWLADRPAVAQRLLVEAIRHQPQAESVLAMAALQMELAHYPEALGWLRRALPLVPAAVRARWLSQPEFAALAHHTPEEWQAMLHEFGVSTETLATDTHMDPTTPPATNEAPAPVVERVLRLSPFAREPRLRLEQVRAYQMEFTLQRLRVTEQMNEEESSMGNYETISQPR